MLRRTRRDDDGGPFLRQPQADGASDPGSGTGDERDLAGNATALVRMRGGLDQEPDRIGAAT
jgi:hypothetical protein